MAHTRCRLCLEDIADNGFVSLEDFEKNMLETLAPLINLDISDEPKICDNCTKRLQDSYNLKALWLENNERVKKLLILQEVYPEPYRDSCCLCGQVIFEGMDNDKITNWKELVEQYIPELDIYCGSNISACKKCVEDLNSLYLFVNNSMEVETKIKEYCIKNAKTQIDLYEVFKYYNPTVESKEPTESDKVVPETNRYDNVMEEDGAIANNVNNSVRDIVAQENCEAHIAPSQNTDANGIEHFVPNVTHELNQYDNVMEEDGAIANNVSNSVRDIVAEENDEAHIAPSQNTDANGIEHSVPNVTHELNQYGHVMAEDGVIANNAENSVRDIVAEENCEAHIAPQNTDANGIEHIVPTVTHELNQIDEISTNNSQDASQRNDKHSESEKIEGGPQNSTDDTDAPARKRRRKRGKSSKQFPCDKCSYVAKYKSALVSHWMSHKTPTETTMYKCPHCPHETKRKADLLTHTIIHKDLSEVRTFNCPECPYRAVRKCDLQQHAFTHQPKIYKCEFCPYITNHHKYLTTRHALLHKGRSEVKTYKCQLCSYETIIKRDLHVHGMQHKSKAEVPTFGCNWCDFRTRYKMGLKAHMIVHTCPSLLEVFECHNCGYTTNRKKDLKNHIDIHYRFRKETLYCASCPFQTKVKRSLVLHMHMHRDPSELKWFKCTECTFQTKRKANLNLHMLRHTRRKAKGNTTSTGAVRWYLPPTNPDPVI